ncbi:MAG: signal peptidase I [Planctomycetota bacterium]
MLARVKDGELFVAGEAASYNEFAEFVLQRYETGTVANLLDKIGLGVDGHHFIVDGENVFSEQFRTALEDRFDQLTGNEQTAVRSEFIGDLSLLRSVLTTNFGPYTVPEDGYLMIGDNRNNSSDGRYFGPVQRSEITGRAFGVAFSFTENKMFALPPDPAWDRFFIGLD